MKSREEPTTKAAPQEARKTAQPKRVEPSGLSNAPAPLPGSILPAKRIVAFYGNPLSKRMGILGEVARRQMLAKLDREVARVEHGRSRDSGAARAAPDRRGAPATPGRRGNTARAWTARSSRRSMAGRRSKNAILFLDVQVGTGHAAGRAAAPRAVSVKRPDVHLGDRSGILDEARAEARAR